MKILMVTDYGNMYGGAETYMFTLKKYLENDGNTVAVLTSNIIPKISENKCTFKCENYKQSKIIYKIFNINAYLKIRKVIKKFRPDIVHLHNFLYCGTPSILAVLKNIPTVMTVHDYAITCPNTIRVDYYNELCMSSFGRICLEKNCSNRRIYYYRRIKMMILKRLLRNVNLFIAPSNFMSNVLNINNIVPIIKLNYSIDLSLFSSEKTEMTENNILFIGRIAKEKGIEYLLAAMPRILKDISDAKLLIAGDGNEKNNLIKMTEQLNIGRHVEFLGAIPPEKTPDLYQKANIVVVPSTWPEVFGIVGLEAMAMGKVVIGSDIGGIPEWLEHGKTGFLVEPRNSDELAEKIIRILSDKELARKLAKNARQKVEKEFNMKNHIEKIEKIYQSLIHC
jgi:glycosyltransferase involved in cell wall biosynthesis